MSNRQRRLGFTLTELVVVVLIIGILAAIGIQQYGKVTERGRIAEAFTIQAALSKAQSRYILKYNTYTGNSSDLDMAPPTAKYFGTLTLTGTANNFTIAVTRSAPTPNTYGAYVLSYIGPGGTLSCGNLSCSNDLLP